MARFQVIVFGVTKEQVQIEKSYYIIADSESSASLQAESQAQGEQQLESVCSSVSSLDPVE